jgi:6-pyruvoyl-tetrahydropterin synthase
MDLAELKAPLKAWIDEHWDHAFLLNASDTVLMTALSSVPEAKVFVMKRGNPSAELMAHELFDVATGALGLPVTRVRVWDTPNQYSEYVSVAPNPARRRNDDLFAHTSTTGVTLNGDVATHSTGQT